METTYNGRTNTWTIPLSYMQVMSISLTAKFVYCAALVRKIHG